MSYILDALKKSEHERRRGEMPEITRFETEADSPTKSASFWPIVVIALIAINGVVVFIWAPWNTESVSSELVKAQPQATEPALRQAQSLSKQAEPETVSRHSANFVASPPTKVAVPIPEPVKERPVVKPQVAPVAKAAPTATPTPEVIRPSVARAPEPSVKPVQTSYLPQLQELPSSVQSRVPDMSFSSHMYSSQPRYRSIIINGRRLKEGQFLNDEIQVREITDKGVILGLDGNVFEVDVLGQWVN